MNTTLDRHRAIRAVTISREYGSGGGEIAARLAERLGWRLVDHALDERVAREIGTNREAAEAHDEHIEEKIIELLSYLPYLYVPEMGAVPPDTLLSAEVYRETFDRLVRAAAVRGDVVIVGRASQVILAGRPDVLHVRVVTPYEQRVAYVVHREGVNRHAAEARIRRKDHDRARYLERAYHHRPDEPELYDLVVNTARLGVDGAVAVIHDAMRAITDGHEAGTGGLAPGLGRYPGVPGDFPALHPDAGTDASVPLEAPASP
jgi:CMP/dCMP kinase